MSELAVPTSMHSGGGSADAEAERGLEKGYHVQHFVCMKFS